MILSQITDYKILGVVVVFAIGAWILIDYYYNDRTPKP